MVYTISFASRALKELEKLPKSVQERINEGIRCLRENPFAPRSGCDIRKLRGYVPPAYALRVGDYRVRYSVDADEVVITGVKHRGRAYR